MFVETNISQFLEHDRCSILFVNRNIFTETANVTTSISNYLLCRYYFDNLFLTDVSRIFLLHKVKA
jgi:hypothetical protein